MARIFLVDDDPDFVEATATILEKNGHEVIRLYDGDECLEKLKEVRPDLIVLDVMMPRLDGYTVCKKLKADPEYSSIPVLLLTAVAAHIPTTRYTQLQGMETEADDYVDKPVEPEELVRRVDTLLRKC